jgi:hypothetical protein
VTTEGPREKSLDGLSTLEFIQDRLGVPISPLLVQGFIAWL